MCQSKVPTKFENLPILRGFCLKSHIFESCHLDQMQNGLDAEFDAFKPFFCVLTFPAEDGFFSKMSTFSGMCQLKKQGTSKSPLHSCGFCHFSIVLVDYDLVEVIVYDAVCLVALAVKGFLVYVFVYIRCTPAAHFHGIFLWYI